MQQHFNLAGKEGPAAVGVLPAYQVSPVVQHYLAHGALRYAKVGLTPKRIKEFGCLPPPESSIFMGDHIMGLVLIKFIVERHLIQETIHLFGSGLP